eukprot:365503-Chlamydomonas_euryale.AAC.5
MRSGGWEGCEERLTLADIVGIDCVRADGFCSRKVGRRWGVEMRARVKGKVSLWSQKRARQWWTCSRRCVATAEGMNGRRFPKWVVAAMQASEV